MERLKAFRNNPALRQFLVSLFDDTNDNNNDEIYVVGALEDVVIHLTE